MTVFISKKHKTPLALNSSKTFFSKVAQVAPPAQVAPFYGILFELFFEVNLIVRALVL